MSSWVTDGESSYTVFGSADIQIEAVADMPDLNGTITNAMEFQPGVYDDQNNPYEPVTLNFDIDKNDISEHLTEVVLTGLPDGSYTWTLQAVDSAYNSGPAAEGTFSVGGGTPVMIFTDGFESGDTSAWSQTTPP